MNTENKNENANISDKNIELLARILLPEIKRYFTDENVKKDFEKWKLERDTIK